MFKKIITTVTDVASKIDMNPLREIWDAQTFQELVQR